MVEAFHLTVTDIKQYFYCPRIIYFTYCQPVYKKKTFKMQFGQDEHQTLEKLETHRTLKRYALEEGQRIFRIRLVSDCLKLSGILDMLIQTQYEMIPVEFKYTTNAPGLNHKYQVTAYALLLEEHFQRSIHRGMIYLIPKNDICAFEITDAMRDQVHTILQNIQKMIRSEQFPEATPTSGHCRDCEYQNYCGDV